MAVDFQNLIEKNKRNSLIPGWGSSSCLRPGSGWSSATRSGYGSDFGLQSGLSVMAGAMAFSGIGEALGVCSLGRTGEANGWFVPISEDFPVFGKAYADLSLEEYRRAISIAQERLWGLNWVCRYERDWDKVPLNT